MSTRYAFSQDEFLSIHPAHLEAYRHEFAECLKVLSLLADHAAAKEEEGDTPEGLATCLDMLVDRLDQLKLRATPEVIAAYYGSITLIDNAQEASHV